MQFPVYADIAGVSLLVLPTGEVKIYGAPTSTNVVGVSGLSWTLKTLNKGHCCDLFFMQFSHLLVTEMVYFSASY